MEQQTEQTQTAKKTLAEALIEAKSSIERERRSIELQEKLEDLMLKMVEAPTFEKAQVVDLLKATMNQLRKIRRDQFKMKSEIVSELEEKENQEPAVN